MRSLSDGSCAIRYRLTVGGPCSQPIYRGAWSEANGETIMKVGFEFPAWEPQYKAALLEVDQARLLERVATAEAAKCERYLAAGMEIRSGRR